MNSLSLLNIHRPVLFETALRDADTTLLQSLRDKAGTLDPRRRKLLETELVRREAATNITWTALIVVLVTFGGVAAFL